MKPIVIIPAYNPDEKLIPVIEKLYDMGLQTVVVNDGSAAECIPIFNMLRLRYGCDVVEHPKNLGKGAALKTGIQYAGVLYPESTGYVTADADGQHAPEDILKIARALEHNPGCLILGTRNFNQKNVPFKSRCGNKLTSFIFRVTTGERCADTQTGLRGIPKEYRALALSVRGDQYEYEMNLLMEMGKKKISFVPVPIETIYLDGNASSHFDPVRDSAIIYYNIFRNSLHFIRFSVSSLISAAADLSLFTLFVHSFFGTASAGILAATIAARLTSGGLNFSLNKFWVFESKRRSASECILYLTLFCGQLLMSWLLVAGLRYLPLHLTFIKVFVDTGLFFISYAIQKNFIFTKKEERKALSQ